MRRLHESHVLDSEIDNLGHMNVRFYLARVQKAGEALMTALGQSPQVAADRGAKLIEVDGYNRFHREQFTGAPLAVEGGILKIDTHSATAFYELLNTDKRETAATFIVEYRLIDQATRAPLALPEEAIAAAEAVRVALPDYGRPRTIDLSPPRLDVSLAETEARLSGESLDPIYQPVERVIAAEECDAFGFLRDGQDMMFGARPASAPANTPREGVGFGPQVQVTDEGHRFGWAVMESRTVRVSQPRAGETLRAIGANIAIHAKTRHTRRWIFNVTTGRLASLNDHVAIALDLDARRAIDIPKEIRRTLESRHVPELA